MRLPTYERARTMALLHRFLRTSFSLGRMPSIIGREIFRTQLQARPARAFEDAVLFICDIEKCLAELTPLQQRLIAFCILENRSEWEASRVFRANQGSVSRNLALALDLLHESLCRKGLLPPLEQELASDAFATLQEEITDTRRKA